MAIHWQTNERRAVVDNLISSHPASSNRCDALARKLLPVARELDTGSETRLVRVQPAHSAGFRNRGPCLVPRVSVGGAGSQPWRSHWTTQVVAHCLDALTGTDGTEIANYFESHWTYPEVLELVSDDLGSEVADD